MFSRQLDRLPEGLDYVGWGLPENALRTSQRRGGHNTSETKDYDIADTNLSVGPAEGA